MDWQVVAAATGIATAVATGFSALAGWWWRRLDRAEPDWVALEGSISGAVSVQRSANFDSDPTVPVRRERTYRRNLDTGRCLVANVGDGRAFRVRVAGVGCSVRLMLEREPPTMREGVVARRWNAYEFLTIAEPGTSFTVKLRSVPWQTIDEARIAISWTISPTWRGWRSRRVQFVPLTDWMPVNWDDQSPPDLGRVVDAEGTIHDSVVAATGESPRDDCDEEIPRSWALLRWQLRRRT